MYWALKDAGTLPASEVMVRSGLCPIVLILFSTTLVKSVGKQMVTFIGMALIGISMVIAGFGFHGMGQSGGLFIGLAGYLLVGYSIREIDHVLRPAK